MMGLLAATGTLHAQWSVDSVMMGAGSANDVFYSLNTGTVKTENNKNWHLAFSMSPSDSGAIWANHNSGNSFVKVYNIHKTFAQWSSVSIADTTGSPMCYNYDKGWYQGALNDLPRPSVFSFGWGTYDLASHNVIGDSMFIVKADTSYYKLFVHQLLAVPMQYAISLENLNGGGTLTDTISRGTVYTDRNFAYYNLATLADTNREPAKTSWDLVFNRYNTLATQGSVTIPYPVIGALSNKGVKVSKAAVVHVDTAFAHFGDYVWPWPATANEISGVGYNWKNPPAGPPPAGWTIPDSISYFIQDLSGNLWQLQFTGYSGSGSGTIYFRKRMVIPTSVNEIDAVINRYEFFPNPCRNELHITLDSKEDARATMTLSAMNGQTIVSKNVKLHMGLNALEMQTGNLSDGQYIITLNGKGIRLSEKITIKN